MNNVTHSGSDDPDDKGSPAGSGKKAKPLPGPRQERPLHPHDLGIQGTVFHLLGTYGVDRNRVIVYIHYIDVDIKNPRQIIPNLAARARADGAMSLRIETNVVNPKLYRLLMRYYGMRREGNLDLLEIPLAREEKVDRG